MKKKFYSFSLICLVICLLLVGCTTPLPDSADTSAGIGIDSNTYAAEPDTGSNTDAVTDLPDVTTTAEADAETSAEVTTEVIEVTAAPERVHLIGDAKNESKISEDLDAGTVSLKQIDSKSSVPSFVFYENGAPLSGSSWIVTGTINTKTVSGKSGHILFVGKRDAANCATIFINRRVAGSNGIWRNIVLDGVRTPSSKNENVSNTLSDSTDWTAEFAFVYYEGRVSLYLKEPDGEFGLMTYYDTEWDTCTAEFAVNQYADVTLSNLKMTRESDKVKEICNGLDGVPENPIDSKRVLFIGNSATYVNNIPQTLSRLARKAGYNVEVNSVTKSGAKLAEHADSSSDHGKNVLNEIAKGYDIVFLQEHSGCISTDSDRASTLDSCKILDKAILASGARTYIYVRPPSGKDIAGYNSYAQCLEYDKLFSGIAQELNAEKAYVNRAFAYAIKNLDITLWGSDNAHTSVEGAYLAVCVFFSTIFNTSSTVLDSDGLPADVALSLQQVADKIVLEQYIPQ